MHKIARGLYLRPLLILTAIAVAMLLVIIAGCSTRPPYRTLMLESLPPEADCPAHYEKARWDDTRGYSDSDAETARVQSAIRRTWPAPGRPARPLRVGTIPWKLIQPVPTNPNMTSSPWSSTTRVGWPTPAGVTSRKKRS